MKEDVTLYSVGIGFVMAAVMISTTIVPAMPDGVLPPVQTVSTEFVEPMNTVEPVEIVEPVEVEPLYTAEELRAMTLTITGECWDDRVQDKRNVAWVICNRARDGRFGTGIVGVITSTRYGVQFAGYWRQGRAVSDNDRHIAAEVLTAYYNGEPSPHGFYYFSSGAGRVNRYR